MKTLREIRLTKEIQERVIMNDGNVKKALQEVLNRSHKDHKWYVDNDHKALALTTWEDILELNQIIKKYK